MWGKFYDARLLRVAKQQQWDEAEHYSAWCYNGNIKRRFRLVSYYGCKPDYRRVQQPYKNLKDKRIQGQIAKGKLGADLYEWWSDIQIVKNVSREKTIHPCPIPETLARRLILLTACAGDTIVDPFAGGGTVLKAASDLGFASVGCELSARYARAAVKRLRVGIKRGT